MRLLGGVLAGGRGRRFGSDKALALWNGVPLIEHVRSALARDCGMVVLVGRDGGLPDRPKPGMGPLGGLNAALAYAATNGFEMVLTAACDTPLLPATVLPTLAKGRLPAYLDGQPLIGLWPTTLAAELDAHLASTTDLSMRAWIKQCGARRVRGPILPNINTPEDLAALIGGFSGSPPPRGRGVRGGTDPVGPSPCRGHGRPRTGGSAVQK